MKSLIDYWSYSSMAGLLRNPLAFKKKYILKVYDDLYSPSSVVGSAGHKALEEYYKGMEKSEAIEEGLNYINNQTDSGIDYGKTGSREKMIKTYTQAINFYFEEMPTYHEILAVESAITTEIESIDGNVLALPAKAKQDLITRNKLGEIEVIDHKFVSKLSDGDVDDFNHFLQSMFAYHTIKAKYGEAPARMIFNECKTSKNQDGSPQMQQYVLEFSGVNDFATFYNLYEACTRFINRDDAIFLPNPADIFDGQNSFDSYKLGVIGVDAPSEVEKRTVIREYKEKQHIQSALDRVENADLSNEEKIRVKLAEFGVSVEMKETHVGAQLTQYTMNVARGVKMASMRKYEDDLALALSSNAVRVEAPIRGTNKVGVEVPNIIRTRVDFAERYLKPNTSLIPIGVDVLGEPFHKDIADMPHLLVAGATGSGKSVFLNTTLTALTKQLKPSQLKLVLIDPKQVELTMFEGDPHLLKPIVTDHVEAAETLDAMVKEMEKRYTKLRKAGFRNIEDYNAKGGRMPLIVVVVDEFADLIMQSVKPTADKLDMKTLVENLKNQLYYSSTGKLTQKAMKAALDQTMSEGPADTETSIIRIAQKARAVGIHLILATQRPSADVVTGLIKANVPTKVAFMATSAVNSQIVLGETGAEKLNGKGDMLFQDPSENSLKRLQGFYS